MSQHDEATGAAEAALVALYAELPALECQGLCQDSCGLTADCVTAYETERITLRLGRVPGWVQITELSASSIDGTASCLTCPLLAGGACSIYPIRPLLCRLWGMVDDPLMRCPHGCRPQPRYLTNHEVMHLWDRLTAISRHAHEGGEGYTSVGAQHGPS